MSFVSNERAAALLARLAALPPDARDAAVDAFLGLEGARPDASPPGDHLIGYHASGVAPILRALVEVPVTRDDVVVDLGSGLGRVVMLARLLTGATARGVELQAHLVERARRAADRLDLPVRFERADAREADLSDATVLFLYAPFTGPVLEAVVRRMESVARRHAIVVCALGVELRAPWLVARALDSFWLAVYDSAIPGVAPRPPARSPNHTAPSTCELARTLLQIGVSLGDG